MLDTKCPYQIVNLLRADGVDEVRKHLDSKYGDQDVLHLGDGCVVPRNIYSTMFDAESRQGR